MNLKFLYSEMDIDYKCHHISKELKEHYYDQTPPIFLIVLGGATFFATKVIPDDFGCEIDYIKLSSYEGTERKELKLIYEPTLDMQDRDIIIIEDIVDSGTTIEYLHNYLKSKNVNSISVVSLLYKKSSEHLVDYKGFEINNDDFVVGCGLDYKGFYRNYKSIYKIV